MYINYPFKLIFIFNIERKGEKEIERLKYEKIEYIAHMCVLLRETHENSAGDYKMYIVLIHFICNVNLVYVKYNDVNTIPLHKYANSQRFNYRQSFHINLLLNLIKKCIREKTHLELLNL